jgi:hypothetical protein
MSKHFGQPVSIVRMEEVLENGRYVSKAVVVEQDPRDNFKDYHLLDFCMDHLKAIGAERTLQDCGSVSTGFGAIDKLSNQLESNELVLDKINKSDK